MLHDLGLQLVDIISIIAIGIIGFGVLKSLISYTRNEYHHIRNGKRSSSFHHIRHDLASHLLLALEMAVAIDIIESILTPSYEHLIKLAALVLLRFLIGYLLNREMRELDVYKFNSKSKTKSGK